MAQWLSWLERRPVTAEAVGSSPIWVVSITVTLCWRDGIIVLKGEYPLRIAYAGVAELADAQDLKSCGW